MRRPPFILPVILVAAAVAAACGGGDNVVFVPPEEDLVPTSARDEATPARDAAALRAADEQEISDLTRTFFEALAAGDGQRVWSILASDAREGLTLQQVSETALAVAQAFSEPAFILNGLQFLSLEGDEAQFFVDGYFTEAGERVGEQDETPSDPMRALREDGAWRISPPLQIFSVQVSFGE